MSDLGAEAEPVDARPKLTHLVDAAVIWAEERRIRAALVAGGFDVDRLDLEGVAKQAVVRDLIAGLRAVGAHVAAAPYGDHLLGLEVIFEFDGDASLLVAKAALTD